jgi:penicillin-binding protein 1A
MLKRTLIRLLLSLTLAGGLLVAAGLAAGYFYVESTLPRVETLADYKPPIITRVYSDAGEVIAEFSRERRIVVPVDRLPKQLVNAFIAAEDSNFFSHQGVDLLSILRAALKNLMAGGIVQGGSTITQQVAKSLLLTPEKKFSRKFKEAILAYRMEKTLSKDDILYLYLNQIYLGHGAYGVQAAAEGYFDKDIQELTLGECAMLAGLPQAPSRYSPYANYGKAKERQKYVLGRMVEEGMISAEQAEAAKAETIEIHPRVNTRIADAGYFTEQVRRYLEETYGTERLYQGGLEVRTTMNVTMQEAAQQAIQENLRNLDKRRVYRGPERVLGAEEVEAYLAGQQAIYDKRPLHPGSFVEGVLTGSDKKALLVRVGRIPGEVPLSQAAWAGNLKVVAAGESAGKVKGSMQLPLGSVLVLKLEQRRGDGSLLLSLEQTPEVQGALVGLDPRSGQVKAMVGGYDFAKSQFNRAIQARRLPGSAIKPLIYAAAIDKGYTPATVILDTPVVYKGRSEKGEVTEWKPKNYEDKFFGPTSFRQALAHSQNVVTVKILEDIGVGYAADYVRKLGVASPQNRDLTLALGSSAVTPLELATAYAVFANGGVRLTPTFITRISDRDGNVLESVDPADFPAGVKSGQKLIRQEPERVLSAETAYLITNLMESVVQDGTGQRAKELGRPVAGKTGTTNELKDAWFAGFVPQLVAVTWVGYDQERTMGHGETGAKAALPGWLGFMQRAVKDLEPQAFPIPDTIEFHAIDPGTGLLAPEESASAIIEAFAPGTAPTNYAIDRRRPNAEDFFKIDLENP